MHPYFALAAVLLFSAVHAEPVDYVFRNAKVYTVNDKQPWAEAVAVKGKRIVYVGKDDQAVQKHIGAKTKVVDLKGRMLVPGFIDSHIHPIASSFMTAGADLQYDTNEEMMQALRHYAQAHPTGPVWGFGWRPDMFPASGPNKRELDAIFPDRPAFMVNIDFHSLWMNSKALETAKIDRHAKDPVPGFSYYQRDAEGEPTGFILEPPAVLPAIAATIPLTPQSFSVFLTQWLPKASAAGLTSIFDAGAPPFGEQGDMIALYADLEKAGKLPLRVVSSYITRSVDEVPPVPKLQELKRRFHSELVETRILKILGDGTEGGYTAVLVEPYADKPETRGIAPFSQAQMNALVGKADAAGVDVHVHCDGDGCTRMALDAIEAAIGANPRRDRRHTICHLVTVHPDDLPRFAKLGVVAQVGVNWATADLDTMGTLRERIGPQRFNQNLYRARSLIESGAHVSFGTDWAAAGYFSTFKPLDVIQIGMTRQLLNKPDGPVLPPADERLTLAQMIKGYTLDAAYQVRLDKRVGSIEVGKQADLVVLEKNLFEVKPHDIHKVKVDATMMNGRFTHNAGL